MENIVEGRAGRGGAGHRHNDVLRRVRIACWITEATDTHVEYIILLFQCSCGYADVPRALLALLIAYFAMQTGGLEQLVTFIDKWPGSLSTPILLVRYIFVRA